MRTAPIAPALTATLATTMLLASAGASGAERDRLHLVGSSTVYPFAAAVAERFAEATGAPAPQIDSVGSGGGLAKFCAGVGVEHPDIANSSRPISPAEIETCLANGVDEIVEVQIGYDGIAIAHSRQAPDFELGVSDLFLALASEVPDPAADPDADPEEAQLLSNPYRSWRAINPALPDQPIQVIVPPPTSGTRDVFEELVLEPGCAELPALAALKASDPARYRTVCRAPREDGAFLEAGEYDQLIVDRLIADPNLVGVFGFSFLDANREQLKGVPIDGVAPDAGSIASGEYPLSRPIFFYLKKAHVGVVPGLGEYVAAFTSEQAFGPDGYLVEAGLIPLPAALRDEVRARAANLDSMALQ